ncbi:histidine kinase [Paenibacillus algorifonticola]|uniref:sensor histidine kinase n=1 Tax=Paenibacillus algorifonticola TaxID=684063 RepID=UPI003D2E6456
MLKFPAHSWRNTIFMRQVIIYLIVILPIILLGVYLYNWSYKNASEGLSRTSEAQLTNYLEALNREIEWMELQEFDLLEDTELNRLVVTWEMMDNVEKRASLNYLIRRLTSFKNSSVYIKDVYVHIRPVNKTISFSNAITDLDVDKYNYFRFSIGRSEQRLVKWENTLHLSTSKYSGKKGEEPLFVIQIELDREKLRYALDQVNIYPESGSFLISDTTGFVLMSDEELSGRLQGDIREVEAASTTKLIIDDKKYHIDKAHSEKLGVTVASYLPEETVRKPLGKFVIWAWLFAIMTFIAIAIYSYSTYKFVHKPLLLLVQSFRRMEGGALDIHIEHEEKDEFGYLYNRFNQMLNKLQALIDQDFKQKLMMQRAELKQLQSQINPHFLYNSFFILNSLARTGDTERIEEFTNMLGEYFRFITRNGEDNVLLAEETRHSRMYTEIQKLRFSRRIRVEFDDLPKEMENIRVPRLIIQPIIENAYEHSLEKMTEDGLLRVAFELDQTEARIIVVNNGNRLSDTEIEALQKRLDSTTESYEMTGMMNIHRRIILTYGRNSGLLLSRGELNSLKVVIRIKLKEENEIA